MDFIKRSYLCIALLPILIFMQECAAVTYRLAQDCDLPACAKLAQDVYCNDYKPFLMYDDASFKKMYDYATPTMFKPFDNKIFGDLLVADDKQHGIIGCLQVYPFFCCEKNSDLWQQFIHYLDNDTLEQNYPWLVAHAEPSAIYLSCFYIDRTHRSKGIGKSFLKLLKERYPQVKKYS